MFLLRKILIIKINLIPCNHTNHTRIDQLHNLCQQEIRVLHFDGCQVIWVILFVFLLVEYMEFVLLGEQGPFVQHLDVEDFQGFLLERYDELVCWVGVELASGFCEESVQIYYGDCLIVEGQGKAFGQLTVIKPENFGQLFIMFLLIWNEF